MQPYRRARNPSRARIAVIGLSLGLLTSVSTSFIPAPAPVAAAYAPELRRYPYLTDVIQGYATVNWGTDTSGTSASVTWGPIGSCTANSLAATSTGITVGSTAEYQWKAMLTLAPDTAYCYRVYLGGTDLLGSDPSPQFRTQLPAGSTQSFSFAVFGDWGNVDATGNSHQTNLNQQIASSAARFAVTTGDTAYSTGSQTNYGDLVQSGAGVSGIFGPTFWTVPGRSIPLFNATGNHGFSNNNNAGLINWPQDRAVAASSGRYLMETNCCVNGTASGGYPSTWYAFDAGAARIYVLEAAWSESNLGTGSQYSDDYAAHWTASSAEYLWLRNDLAAHPGGVKMAFFHYPFYSDNAGQSTDTFLLGSQSLEGLLGQNGVKLAFNGHAHLYERNKTSSFGVTSYVSGGGGGAVGAIDHCSPFDAYGIGWSSSSNVGKACNAPVPSSVTQVYHFLLPWRAPDWLGQRRHDQLQRHHRQPGHAVQLHGSGPRCRGQCVGQ